MEGTSWHGEWCKRCNRRNVVGFWLPDDVWNAVVGGRWNVLCPTCFDEEAEAAGVEYTFDGKLWPVISWSDWGNREAGMLEFVPQRLTPEPEMRYTADEVIHAIFRVTGMGVGKLDVILRVLAAEHAVREAAKEKR